MTTNESIHALSLRDIAAWQIEGIFDGNEKAVVADLPALQRSAVWKVQQIEELWDSVLRGFPIGSFILSPPNTALLRQDFKLQRARTRQSPRKHSHLLLDGQQRATAIALAFNDLWLHPDAAQTALWVDLAAPTSERQVDYVFRVLTRPHPWGYLRSNPQAVLSASAMRAALHAWQVANQCPDKRPDEFTLRETWPWDCEAPVPVPLLIAALDAHPNDLSAARDALWERLQGLPLFRSNAAGKQQDTLLRAAFTDTTAPNHQRLNRLMHRLRSVLHGPSAYRVPALMLDLTPVHEDTHDAPSGQEAKEQTKDAIELLFVRINSAGTPLAGEELAYSLLKAEWPEVAQWMQELPNKPAQPSRIAALCIRLVLARTVDRTLGNQQASLPTMPGMQELRRLLRNTNPNHPHFRDDLQNFITTDAQQCFADAWTFLTDSRKDFALLPAQAIDIAKNAADVYLLLLRWIDRLAANNLTPQDLQSFQHRRTLGFLTALAWFAPDKNRACAAIWPDLEADVDAEKLKNRFNATRFRIACQLSERGTLRMIPLPSPDELAVVCQGFMENDGRTRHAKAEATMHFPKGRFWKDGNWWYDQFVPELAQHLRETWEERVTRRTNEEQDEHETPDYAELVQQIASHFLDTLWEAKSSVLLYAQRDALKTWFPGFDPSLPEMMEDRNRPWDWDHLLPQSYFSGRWGIPQSVKDWGNSIGNLRAWPLEANRSDGDAVPSIKLDGNPSAEEKRYKIGTGRRKRQASFVDDSHWERHWKSAVPDDTAKNYLSNSADSSTHQYRISAVTGMMDRFLALYSHWYEELKLKNLAKDPA